MSVKEGKINMSSNNTPPNGFIEFKFVGEELKPENVKASEVADLLKAIEDVVESNVFEEHPELDKNQLIIGLVNVKSDSLGLQFQSPLPEYAQSGFRVLGDAVSSENTISLSPRSRNALTNIVRFTRNKRCTTDLIISDNNHRREILATITPETRIDNPAFLKGETIVYARVVRTGGKEPKVEIETINGRTLFCDAPLEVTKMLGTKLYETVGLIGVAEWDTELNNIEQFSIKDVTDYEQIPLKEAMRELAEVTKEFYKDIDDVGKYISNIRGSE